MRCYRKFSGTNSARKTEAMARVDIAEALECGVASNIAEKLTVRGKRHKNMLPDSMTEWGTNRGHGPKQYGVRQKKRSFDRTSIRENPLTEEDFYDIDLDEPDLVQLQLFYLNLL